MKVDFLLQLLQSVYLPIFSAILIGVLLSAGLGSSSRLLPTRWAGSSAPHRSLANAFGKYLFYIGIPICIVNFVRSTGFSLGILLAPVVAWCTMGLAILVAVLVLRVTQSVRDQKDRASFLLLSYLGNTSYLGIPIVLLLPQLGEAYFSWAVLYDVLGTFFASYGLGLLIASWDSNAELTRTQRLRTATRELLTNPSLFAFVLGLALKAVELNKIFSQTLNGLAWSSIMLCLVVMGMRLQQLVRLNDLRLAIQPVAIKMIFVPVFLAAALTSFGLEGPPRLVLVLQASMPCGFATLVLAERYGLTRDRVVAALALSTLLLMLLIPVWVSVLTTW
jgi:malate permease and related proteins